MKYDPRIHHRRSIRLKGYDYSKAGAYFITICCEDRLPRFGEVVNAEMVLNQYGTIAFEQWLKLADRFGNFQLDVFQIMPDHMHAIIVLNDVGATFTVAHPQGTETSPVPSISDILGAYKSLVSNECLKIYKSNNETMNRLWQRNYYEHIIRDENAYRNISNYIINNPANWKDDKFHK